MFSFFCGECVKNNQKVILFTVVQLSNRWSIVCVHSHDRYFLFRSFPSHHLLGFRFSTFSHKEERCCQPITRSTSSKHADLSIYIWHIIFIGIWFFQYIQIFGCPWIFLWVVTLHLHPIQNNCVQWGIFFCDQWRHLTFNRKSPQPVSW